MYYSLPSPFANIAKILLFVKVDSCGAKYIYSQVWDPILIQW